MRRLMMIAAVTGGLAAGAAPAAATTGERATCSYDVTGKIDPGLDDLVMPNKTSELRLTGPVSCQGRAWGRLLDGLKGRMTLTGTTGSGPTGALYGSSCVFADLGLRVTVSFPTTRKRWHGHRRPLRFTEAGDYYYLGEAFDGQNRGSIGDEALLGRAGIGSDPDGQHGLCTKDAPYRDLAITGEFALLDNRQGQGTNHDTVIASDEYVTGGTANAIAYTSPYAFSQPLNQGDTLTFTNADTHPHTVTACAAPCTDVAPQRTPQVFDGDLVHPGSVYALDTSSLAPGTYYYLCEYHPFMRGSFTVGPRSG